VSFQTVSFAFFFVRAALLAGLPDDLCVCAHVARPGAGSVRHRTNRAPWALIRFILELLKHIE
jgi:hypothetical protein